MIPTPCVQILKGRMFAAAYVALTETVETAQVNSISVIKFATLEARGKLESKCVPQLVLGLLLGTRRSVIGFFFNIHPFTL